MRVLTTQKVSHPPVKPKYGALLAPARPLLNIAMAHRVSMWSMSVRNEAFIKVKEQDKRKDQT